MIKNNDLLFEIYFSATPTHDDRYYSTQVVYSAMLSNLLQLYSRLLRLSLGNEIPIFRENNHRQALGRIIHTTRPESTSRMVNAKDLYTVVKHGKYRGWAQASEVYGKLFVLLHQREWDKGLEHVRSWTAKDINIQGLPAQPGNWTTQEELDNTIKVVMEYVDKRRKAHPRQQQA